MQNEIWKDEIFTRTIIYFFYVNAYPFYINLYNIYKHKKILKGKNYDHQILLKQVAL